MFSIPKNPSIRQCFQDNVLYVKLGDNSYKEIDGGARTDVPVFVDHCTPIQLDSIILLHPLEIEEYKKSTEDVATAGFC